METARTLTLDDLTNLFDDLDPTEIATESNDNYADAPSPAPLAAGKYGVQLKAIDVDRDQAGTVRNNKQFVCDFNVVDPEDKAGRVVRFIRVSMETKKRTIGGIEKRYNEVVDLIRAFDAEFDWQNNPQAALRFLLECVAENRIAFVQIDWKAWDTKFFDVRNGASLERGSAEHKILLNQVMIRGARKFDKDGTYLSPDSGNLLKARPFISRTYPAKRSSV